MLHLLPSVLSKKIASYFSARRMFLGELIFFVFCAHVMIFGLFVLFSSLHHQQEQFSISLGQSGSTYVLMPLQKKVSDSGLSRKRKETGSITKSKVIDYETYQKHKKAKRHHKKILKKHSVAKVKAKAVASKRASVQMEHEPIVPLSEALVSRVLEPKTLRVKKASLTLQALPKSKLSPKTKVKSSKLKVKQVEQILTLEIPYFEPDPVAEIEVAVTQSVQPQTVQPQIVELQISIPTESPEAVIVPLEIEAVEPEVLHAEQSLEQQIEVSKNDEDDLSDDIDLEQVVFFGREQLDNSIVASKLKQAVEQCWNPPVGIKKGTSCQMRVHVNSRGKAEEVKIIQSSRILMYDSPARKALFAMHYPKEVWNKTITIALGV